VSQNSTTGRKRVATFGSTSIEAKVIKLLRREETEEERKNRLEKNWILAVA